MSQWKYVGFTVASGAVNMQTDQMFFSECEKGTHAPVLRFYSWEPWCISLGRNQPVSVVNHEASRALGIDVVHRITGGGAVLHGDDISYLVAGSRREPPFDCSLEESYFHLHSWLINGFRDLGIKAEIGACSNSQPDICFSDITAYEIHVKGRKIVGSSQRRGKKAVLQHGSIQLKAHSYFASRIFNLPDCSSCDEFAEYLNSSSAGIYEFLPNGLAKIDILKALKRNFETYFSIKLH